MKENCSSRLEWIIWKRIIVGRERRRGQRKEYWKEEGTKRGRCIACVWMYAKWHEGRVESRGPPTYTPYGGSLEKSHGSEKTERLGEERGGRRRESLYREGDARLGGSTSLLLLFLLRCWCSCKASERSIPALSCLSLFREEREGRGKKKKKRKEKREGSGGWDIAVR